MENEKDTKSKSTKGWIRENFSILISLALVVVMLLTVVSPLGLFTTHDAPFQLLAACLGAIVTVLITSLLLKSQAKQQHELQQEQAKQQYELQQKQIAAQREADENKDKKEKENQLREKKIQSYSEFISSMYSLLNKEGDVEESDLASFRENLFSKLVFYIKPESLSELKSISDDFQKIDKNDKDKLLESFSSITSLLRDDLNTERRDETDTVNTLMSIWSNVSITKTKKEEKITETPVINAHYNFWHFNMWGDEQIAAFRKGLYELSLMEYEETWRTNLVQQVEFGDIVFLFRRGGWGYIGAFKVKGWRVFFNEENGVTETIYLDGNPPYKVTDVQQVNKDIEQYDIYESISDGASSCANLIVDPIAFDYEGVSYPGGVYRRTISRYDGDYARSLLSRFVTNNNKPSYNMLWDEREGQKGYITKINSNTQFFEKVVLDLLIKPAEKDQNGNWV